ncbi:MAG: inositol monophosphatase family protein [Zoogloeaceae bacterium]|nr:inositol monophosphatase family protein [Zoogloeaceae bacterium]
MKADVGAPAFSREELLVLRDQVERIAREIAEREILPRFLKVSGRVKQDGSLFSDADIAAQDALMTGLSRVKMLPVIGEEMSEGEQRVSWARGLTEGVWVLDPIDGSTNFLAGLPQFAVSIALMQGGVPVLGASWLPILREMYSAVRGCGVWINGRPVARPAFAKKEMADVVAAIDFRRLPPGLALRLLRDAPIYSQRSFGSSVLDWCYLAAGRLDVITHGGECLWDYAAGQLMTEEMGGSVSVFGGDVSADPPWRRSVIAALNPRIFQEWKDWLNVELQKEFP